MNTITLTYNVKFCILLLYLVLALITIAAYILGFMKKDVENFKTRMKSFWIIVILFTAAFMFNKLAANNIYNAYKLSCIKRILFNDTDKTF